MQIPLWVGRVSEIHSFSFWSYHVWQQSKDYSRLARIQESQGYSILLRFHKLLLPVHLQLLEHCHSIDMPYLEGHSLEVWLLLSRCFQLSQESIYFCSYPHLLDSQCLTHCRNWCFGLRSHCNSIHCVVATTRQSLMITQVVKLSVKQSSGEKHKRTWQGASAKLESYLYCYMLVHATISCLPHILLKATMCTSCALTSSSISFYYVLGLWCHIMWPVMWLQYHMPLYHQ